MILIENPWLAKQAGKNDLIIAPMDLTNSQFDEQLNYLLLEEIRLSHCVGMKQVKKVMMHSMKIVIFLCKSITS